jgi:hypothetical protein
MCTHIFEETEPNDKSDIPNFRERWLANLEGNNIKVQREKIQGFHVIKKISRGKEEITIVMKEDLIVLLQMHTLSSLETLIDNKDSIKACEILGIDPEEFRSWQEVEEIK